MTYNSLKSRLGTAVLQLLCAAFAIGLVLWGKDTAQAAQQALVLCATVVIPSIFPFFIASSMINESGLSARLGRLLSRPMSALFRLPGACAPVIIMGILGGYPVGARAAAESYRTGNCTEHQANAMLTFCNNCGPGFVIGAVGVGMLGSSSLGAMLYCVHVLSALLIGVFLRSKNKKMLRSLPPIGSSPKSSFSGALIRSVSNAAQSMLYVCALIVLFSVLMRMISLSGVLPQNSTLGALLIGSLEVTNGVFSASKLPGIEALCAISLLLGWGGLSVHFQAFEHIHASKLSARRYLLGKALHGPIASLLTAIAVQILPDSAVHSWVELPMPILPIAPIDNYMLYGQLKLGLAMLGVVLLAAMIFHCKYPDDDI